MVRLSLFGTCLEYQMVPMEDFHKRPSLFFFFHWDKVELALHTLKVSNCVCWEMPGFQLCQSCSSCMQAGRLFTDVWRSLITAELIKQCHSGVCETSQVPNNLESVVNNIHEMLWDNIMKVLLYCNFKCYSSMVSSGDTVCLLARLSFLYFS